MIASTHQYQESFLSLSTIIDNVVWMPDPETLIIKNDLSVLTQNTDVVLIDNSTALQLSIRTAFLTPITNQNIVAVMHNSYTVKLQQFNNYAHGIFVQHICTTAI